VLGPGGEVVCVVGELCLEGVDGLGVFKEEDLVRRKNVSRYALLVRSVLVCTEYCQMEGLTVP
jgi:hypothetical protein